MHTSSLSANRLLPAGAFLICIAVGWWIVTAGTGHPFKPYSLILATFYDAQADAILAGQLNVPCSAIRGEAFIVDGLCYGYFGITPALFRMPLNAVFPEYRGHWGTLSVMTAYCLLLWNVHSLCRTLQRHLVPVDHPNSTRAAAFTSLVLIAIGLGSTSVFLLSRPVLHHEAIIWASALGLGGLLFVVKYIFVGEPWSLICAVAFGLLAINARPPAGLLVAMACGLAPSIRASLRAPDKYRRPFREMARRLLHAPALFVGVMAFGSIVGSYVAINYAKLGTPGGIPLKYYASTSPSQLERLKGSFIHLANIPWNVSNHFSTEGLRSASQPPYVAVQIRPQGMVTREGEEKRFPRALIFGIEPFVSIPVGMTSLLALSVGGCLAAIRLPHRAVLIIILLLTLVGPLISLMAASISYRYLHEYILFFTFAGALMTCYATSLARRASTAWFVTLSVLTVLNVAFNISFALIYQSIETNLGYPLRVMPNLIGGLIARPLSE